jgi:hypothetical protein
VQNCVLPSLDSTLADRGRTIHGRCTPTALGRRELGSRSCRCRGSGVRTRSLRDADTNDAERLAEDPTFRMLTSRERRETSVALTSTLHWFDGRPHEGTELPGLARLNTELVQRTQQDRLLGVIAEHQSANRSYLDDGIRLLELAQRAAALFKTQPPREKRHLLNFVVSNCRWKGGELQVTYRQAL